MRTISKLKFMLKLILLFFFSCAFTKEQKITREVAIKLAENFISVNGYSDKKPVESKLKFELLDNLDGRDKTKSISARFKTLNNKAIFISEDEDFWHIGFVTYSYDLKKLDTLRDYSKVSGRAVKVKKTSGLTEIAHKTPLFNKFLKI
jgi:hypothetical protein